MMSDSATFSLAEPTQSLYDWQCILSMVMFSRRISLHDRLRRPRRTYAIAFLRNS
jgi:hypothetical protein